MGAVNVLNAVNALNALNAPARDAEPLINGAGTADAWWLPWLADAGITPLPDAVLRSTDRLVVIAPHPDDEILCAGGLMRRHRRGGGDVAVIAVSDGEASHPDDPQWTAQRLAAARRDESRRGLATLDIADAAVTRLALPDGQVGAQSMLLQQALTWLLQPGDVVLTTWREDGHPDHEATARAAAAVCEAKGCRLLEAPVWMWHWAAPGDPRVPWSRLRAIALTADERAAKQSALQQHRSQLADRPGDAGPVLCPSLVERAAREVEHVFI